MKTVAGLLKYLVSGNQQLLADKYENDRKLPVFCRNIFAFGLIGHLLFIPIFYLLGNPIIFINNIVAVLLDVFCLWTNQKEWRGSLLVWVAEIAVHAFLCCFVFGWAQGYTSYFFALVPIIFFSSYRFSLRTTVSALLFLATFYLYHYTRTHLPITESSYQVSFFVYAFNVFINFVGLSYAAFYYRRYSERLEHELLDLAHTDSLTGLDNRRMFDHQVSRLLKERLWQGEDSALLIFDIDYFKQINDTYGHMAGDQALRRVAASCRHLMRHDDQIGRIGGEEFAVFLTPTDRIEALHRAEQLRHRVAQCRVKLDDGSTFSMTISIGVTLSNSRKRTLPQLMLAADQALYEAKSRGRNRIVFGD